MTIITELPHCCIINWILSYFENFDTPYPKRNAHAIRHYILMGNKNSSKKDVWLADPGYAKCPSYALVVSHVGYKVTYWIEGFKKTKDMMLPLDRVRGKVDAIESRGGSLDRIERIESGASLIRVYDPFGTKILREKYAESLNEDEKSRLSLDLIRSVNLERHYSTYMRAESKKK